MPDIGDFLGCSVPDVRKIAKSLTAEEADGFLKTMPHEYYDENMLHGLLLGMQKGTAKSLDYSTNFCLMSTIGGFATQ